MLKTKNRIASRLQMRTAKSGRRFVVGTVSKVYSLPAPHPDPKMAGTVSGVYSQPAPHPDPKVVKRAEKVFAGMGMTGAEAVALFYRQTVLRGDFPITELIPNEATQAAIRDARAGIGLIRGRSAAEMLREAEVDDCVN